MFDYRTCPSRADRYNFLTQSRAVIIEDLYQQRTTSLGLLRRQAKQPGRTHLDPPTDLLTSNVYSDDRGLFREEMLIGKVGASVNRVSQLIMA